MTDYYKILGVSRKASQKEIEDAYRVIVRENHPDLYPGDQERADRLALANKAYQVLRDPEKRKEYDAQIQATSQSPRTPKPRNGAPPAGTRSPFGEVFATMMTPPTASPPTASSAAAKPTAQYQLWISETEARNGGVKRIQIGDQIVSVVIRPGAKDKDIVQIPVVIRIKK
ncbi:MAG: DnaJ domain-containing protein [Candidatus Caldarchaeum sp.]